MKRPCPCPFVHVSPLTRDVHVKPCERQVWPYASTTKLGVSRPMSYRTPPVHSGCALPRGESSNPCQSSPVRVWQPSCSVRAYDDVVMLQRRFPRVVGLIGT